MTTTVVAVFHGQNKADEALTALRSQLSGQNIAILVRSEQQTGEQFRTAECMNGFTQEAINLTSSAGNLMFRTLSFTANAMLTMPFRMMAPMVHGLTSYMDNTTGGSSCQGSGAMLGSMAGSGAMAGGMGGSTTGTHGEKVEITLQGEGDLKGVTDILQSHGAAHVHTYMDNAGA